MVYVLFWRWTGGGGWREGRSPAHTLREMTTNKIPSSDFYGEYHGHKLAHLKQLYPYLREQSDGLIWTAGDSSLDNKYW